MADLYTANELHRTKNVYLSPKTPYKHRTRTAPTPYKHCTSSGPYGAFWAYVNASPFFQKFILTHQLCKTCSFSKIARHNLGIGMFSRTFPVRTCCTVLYGTPCYYMLCFVQFSPRRLFCFTSFIFIKTKTHNNQQHNGINDTVQKDRHSDKTGW